MDIIATQVRSGMVLMINNELFYVVEANHVTPGKGVACMQVKLKNVHNAKNLDKKLRSSEKVNKVDLRTHSVQYLYADPSGYIFMNNESFDQFTIPKEILKNKEYYLKEGESYSALFYEDTVINIEFPHTIDLTVVVAPPEIKKATATNSMRPITLENDLEILAPHFIKEGDVIRVNTQDNTYVERV